MRWKIAVCALSLVLAGVSCESADDDPSSTIAEGLDADEFSIEGVVVDTKAGVKPSSDIEGFEDATSVGGIAIRPSEALDAEGLDGCTTTRDAYVTYYTSETEATDLDDATDWPENLEGTTIRAEGTRYEADDADDADDADADDATDTDDATGTDDAMATGSPDTTTDDLSGTCVLVLDRIEPVTADAPATDGTTDDGDAGAGAGGTDGTAEPGATGSPEPTAGGTPDFPEVDDTDPIFEGDASPDPCEGQKACEEKREEGEIP